MIAVSEAIATMEPICAELGPYTSSLGDAATVSIAISLKRIADVLAPVKGTDVGTTLFHIEQALRYRT